MIYDCPVGTVLYVKRVNSAIIIKEGIDSKSVKIECYSIYRFMLKKSRLLENASDYKFILLPSGPARTTCV